MMTACTRGLATSSCQRLVDALKPYSSALRAAPSAVVLQMTSHTGRRPVLKRAPTALRATAWALPIYPVPTNPIPIDLTDEPPESKCKRLHELCLIGDGPSRRAARGASQGGWGKPAANLSPT